MQTIRPADERGHVNLGWLDSRHSFSFGHYYDPDHVNFGTLRVINEDRIRPGAGFGEHGHRDMEIVTYVLDGALDHRDSLGNGSTIRPGDVQRMTAGTGIRHSEYNASRTEPVHLLQIWIIPEETGLEPSYEQVRIADEERRGRLRLIASRDGRDGSVTIHQDADLYAAVLADGDSASFEVRDGRRIWVQLVRGALSVNGECLAAGDATGIDAVPAVEIDAQAESEFLLFDLAA